MIHDDYNHYDENLFYIVENVLGPPEQSVEYEKLKNDFNSQLSEHCSCGKDCVLPTCKCLLKSFGENYPLDCQGEDNHKLFNINNTKPSTFECNKRCSCFRNCNNRTVQKGPIHCLKITPCDKGLGLFTTRFIRKGTFICEYAGELITSSQANIRHHRNLNQGKMNYIICLREYSKDSVLQTFIDPSDFGNIGRYMNHSCEPNCHIIPVRCDSPLPKLAIFTLTDVLPMTELTFHYGCDSSNEEIIHRIKCLCNSKTCSGFIPFANYEML